MFYFALISAILIYIWCAHIDNLDGKKLALSLLPIAVVFILTFSLQNDVGTDYTNYIDSATNDSIGKIKINLYVSNGEILFAGLLYLAQLIGVPQSIFFFTALFQVVPFCIAMYQLKKENSSLFYVVFLYFTLSLSFFNQFNGIRQFAAANIMFLATIFIFRNPKRWWPWCILAVAVLFHRTAIIMIAVVITIVILSYFFPKVIARKKVLYIMALLCTIFYFVDINGIIIFFIDKLNIFTGYLTNNYVEKMQLSSIATKLVKLAVVFYAIYRLDTRKLTRFESSLLAMSYVAVLILILAFSSTIIWRIYLFVDIFIIFPVLLFYKYDAKLKEKWIINVYLSVFLLVKILILPQGEYLYRSIIW